MLETADGRFFRGTRELFAHLRECHPWQFEDSHRRRFEQHRDARVKDVAGELLAHFRGEDDLEPAAAGSPDEGEVVNAPDASRYELRVGRRLVGTAAYERHDDRIVFTHTLVDESSQGLGFGSRLAAAALDDARRQGLEIVPLCPFIAAYIERHPQGRNLV